MVAANARNGAEQAIISADPLHRRLTTLQEPSGVLTIAVIHSPQVVVQQIQQALRLYE